MDEFENFQVHINTVYEIINSLSVITKSLYDRLSDKSLDNEEIPFLINVANNVEEEQLKLLDETIRMIEKLPISEKRSIELRQIKTERDTLEAKICQNRISSAKYLNYCDDIPSRH